MNNGDFSSFLEALGQFESGININKDYAANQLDWLYVFDPQKGNVDRSSVDLTNAEDLSQLQYHVHNTLGFLGKYQFGEALLIDLGYYIPADSGYYPNTSTNEWQGTWTGKNGVNSKEDFMSNMQELAIREAFTMNMQVIDTVLSAAGHSIEDYLGKEYTYQYQGEAHTTQVTMSGILASAHLQGPNGVALLLMNDVATSDEYGTNILLYMDSFSGHDTPFGTNADDYLSGSDYSETFSGGAGHDLYHTGGGEDLISITPSQIGVNKIDEVLDFDPANDVIALGGFGIEASDVQVSITASDTVIHIPGYDNEIILKGVSPDQITPANFVYGPYTLGWNYGSHDTVIENFNATHDVINLNNAFGLNNLAIYEENGSTVIEVVNNDQRYVLQDVPLSDLDSFHFVKAPVGFAETYFQNEAEASPSDPNPVLVPSPNPDVVDTVPDVDPTPPPSTDPVPAANQNLYAYNWSWGANDVIENFSVANDAVDLAKFWLGYTQIELYQTRDGDTLIDLTEVNNQTITLKGVTIDELSAANFVGVSGNYADIQTQIQDPSEVVVEETDFQSFLNALGAFESGIDVNKIQSESYLNLLGVFDPARGNVDPNSVDIRDPLDLSQLQYHVHNQLGFVGKYQFGEALLIDLGYYTPGEDGTYYGNGAATNEWNGTFTGKNGVYSKEDFMSDKQELIIQDAFDMNLRIINEVLSNQGKTIADYLGKEYVQNEETIVVTISGILAGAHLRGAYGLSALLVQDQVSSDENGTSILTYVGRYGGHETPFGENGDVALEGRQVIELERNPTGSDVVIQNFDVSKDILDLGYHFGLADLVVYAQDGNAVIEIDDIDQKFILANVALEDLKAYNFQRAPVGFSDQFIDGSVLNNEPGVDATPTPDPDPAPNPDPTPDPDPTPNPDAHDQSVYSYSWNWGGHDVVNNFDASTDVIDLHNFWTDYSAFDIYNDMNGNAVIDLTNLNNQTITLTGVNASDLTAQNISGVNGSLSQALAEQGGSENSSGGNSEPGDGNEQSGQDVLHQGTDGLSLSGDNEANDTFVFTWQWGSNHTITQFDVNKDVVDLHNFWTNPGSVAVHDDANGNAIIDLTDINNQTITLLGVSSDDLSEDNFIY